MMTNTMVECAECLSSDLNVVFGHDCPNESANATARTVADRVNIDPPTRNGNGNGSGSRSTNNKATDKQIAFMLSLGVPKHIAEAATKASASDHIARILEENKRNASATTPSVDGATDKQKAFLASLLSSREHSFTGAHAVDVDTLSKREASDLIGKLKDAPKASATVTPTAPNEAFSDGFYIDQRDNVYKVQKARTSDNLYAKILSVDTGEFEYAPGAITKLKSMVREGRAEKLTLEKAKSLGKLYGRCMDCGRTLTDENSIREGIGPICAGKDHWS